MLHCSVSPHTKQDAKRRCSATGLGGGVELERFEEARRGGLAHALIGVRYAQVGQRAHVVGFDFERPVSRNTKY